MTIGARSEEGDSDEDSEEGSESLVEGLADDASSV